ncbi:MAG: nucleotide exchange factor GrpE [Rhodospirillaceae bacterium]|nr:nucleotide exchange factor GrpE [Rhodospirillaceae bacterium]
MSETENRTRTTENPAGRDPAAEPEPDELDLEAAAEAADAAARGPAGDAAAEGAADDPAALIARLAEENATLKDRALRAMAEAENTRRRAQKDKEDTAKYAVSSFARDVLTVADNLARAVDALPDDKADDPVFANMRAGIAAVEQELLKLFERHGIVRIDPTGEKFDPNYHQAMYEIPTTDAVPGTVVQVMQAGYVLHGRLLRPAMVGVAKGEPPQKVDEEV